MNFKCSMNKKKESLLKKKKVREENLDLDELKKVEADLFAQLKAKCKQRPVQRVWDAKDFLTKWGLNGDDKLAISALFEADYYEKEDASEIGVEYVYVKGDVFYENYKYDLYETNHGKESEESLIRMCIDTLQTMLKADGVTVFDNNTY